MGSESGRVGGRAGVEGGARSPSCCMYDTQLTEKCCCRSLPKVTTSVLSTAYCRASSATLVHSPYSSHVELLGGGGGGAFSGGGGGGGGGGAFSGGGGGGAFSGGGGGGGACSGDGGGAFSGGGGGGA